MSKSLREMVVFARQNLIADPPFSRMDLISCRNLLIYLDPTVHKEALPTFHYALKPHGFLLLGASESVGGFNDLFEPVDKKHKIYSKKSAPTPALHLSVVKEHGEHPSRGLRPHLPIRRQGPPEPPEGLRGELDAQREADRITINQFAAPGVLINDALQVLQFRGQTRAYLQPPAGKASFDVLKMARDGLMFPLRDAIKQARKENRIARKENVRIQRNARGRTVNLSVIPLKNLRDRCYLILFEDTDDVSRASVRATRAAEPPEIKRAHVAELERDLSETRDYLQSMQEQHEAAQEELQAASEEVQSTNEELQSVNEELETSKEELESSNEELTTLNEEMNNRNVELNRLNSDLVNLQTSTGLAIVLVGRDLTVRRFSPEAEKQFALQASDIGRPILHVRHNLLSAAPSASKGSAPLPADTPVNLEKITAEVIASVRAQEYEVRQKSGRWHSLRVLPYMTVDNKVDGAVLVLVDIDVIKRGEQAIAASRDYAENTIATMRESLLVLDKELRIESANRAFYRTFRVTPRETLGRQLYDLGNGQWVPARLRELLEDVVEQNTTVEDFQVECDFDGLGRKVLLLNARCVYDPHRESELILVVMEDITHRQEAEASAALLSAIVTSSEDAIISKNLDGVITSWNKGAENVFGYAPAEVIGKSITLLIPEDHLHEEPRILERVRRGEAIEHYESVRRRKDGSLLDISLTVSPLKDASGRIIGASKIARDISERNQGERDLRTAERRWKTIFESVAVSLWEEDFSAVKSALDNLKAQGVTDFARYFEEHPEFLERAMALIRVLDVNDATVRMFQANDKAELLGSMPKIFGPASMQVFAEELIALAEGRTYFEAEALLSTVRGNPVYVFFTMVLPTEEPPDRVLFSVVDITERREMEKQIQQQAGELAEESRRKDEFLAMLSHELRNPLAPIRSAVHLLRMHDDDNENTIQQQAHKIIERQVANLTRMVNDLLEVSRVVSGRHRLDRRPVDVNQVIRHAMETVMPLIEHRGHELVSNLCPNPVWIHADATRVEEVFVNLLDNSVKYTPDRGRIEISSEQEDDTVRVRVRDNGAGIEEALLPRIFDLFTQADRSLDRSAGGLGIGLSLAKRLIDLHGGTIEAHSPPGGSDRGSEFIVTLHRMVAPPEQQPEAPTAQTLPGPDGARVLVVDDNVDQVTLLDIFLRAKGFSVRVSFTGPEGLEIARQWRPDIALLDIGLPGMNGYELARRLRRDVTLGHSGMRMRVIALSGYGRESDTALAREAGFDGHLVKPFGFEELEGLMVPASGKKNSQGS